MANTELSESEINRIIEKFTTVSNKDITIKQRQFNIERLTPFNKVIYKNKKNRHKFYKYKNKYKNKENIIFKPDPYKFKQLPSNIRETIVNLVNNNQISFSTLAHKSRVPLHVIEHFIYNNKPIDNYDLKLILDYFNYNLN
tara:strand:+ start:44 stop:466 length:423 start_codon:yes stop_codon:yes gene_type:complete